jgi:hypothetical protein
MPYVSIDVDDVLSEIDDDDLLEEVEARGLQYGSNEIENLVTKIWMKRREGKDYQKELNDLIYVATGRII